MTIQIENESQWRTEDLANIVKRIEDTPGFRREDFYSSTILYFKTSRKKPNKHLDNDEPKAAEYIAYGSAADQYAGVKLVVIRSVEKIGAEVLDRLANSDVQQDVSPDIVKLIVKETAKAIGGWRTDDLDFSWYKEVPLRIGKAPKRSRVIAEREIQALRSEQGRIRARANNQIRALQDRIDKIKEKRLPD